MVRESYGHDLPPTRVVPGVSFGSQVRFYRSSSSNIPLDQYFHRFLYFSVRFLPLRRVSYRYRPSTIVGSRSPPSLLDQKILSPRSSWTAYDLDVFRTTRPVLVSPFLRPLPSYGSPLSILLPVQEIDLYGGLRLPPSLQDQRRTGVGRLKTDVRTTYLV